MSKQKKYPVKNISYISQM